MGSSGRCHPATTRTSSPSAAPATAKSTQTGSRPDLHRHHRDRAGGHPPRGTHVAQLMRPQAEHAGLHLSVRELLGELSGIAETVLLYHDGGPRRPRAQRLLTDMNPTQRSLYDLFNLDRHAPNR